MAIHKSGEDYLEAILIIKNKKGKVKSTDVASFLNYSRPSVCNAVDLLQKDGFLIMDDRKHLELTPKGLIIAKKMYDRHCFLTDLLKNIGVDEETAEKESCQIEHILSETTFNLIKQTYYEYTKK